MCVYDGGREYLEVDSEHTYDIDRTAQVLILSGDKDLEDAFLHHKTFETEDGKWYFSDSAIIFVDEENQDSKFCCRIDTRHIRSSKNDSRSLRHLYKKDGFYELGINEVGNNINLQTGKKRCSLSWRIMNIMLNMDHPTNSVEMFGILHPLFPRDYEFERKEKNIITRRMKDLEDCGYINFIGKDYYNGMKLKMYTVDERYKNGSKMFNLQ